MKSYPTRWQKKVLWAALTGLAITFLFALGGYLILALGEALGFLQPILIPVAVAGILAYLLNPLVNMTVGAMDRFIESASGTFMGKVARKIKEKDYARMLAVIFVFACVFLPFAGIMIWIVPQAYNQSLDLAKEAPTFIEKGKGLFLSSIEQFKVRFGDSPYVAQGIEWLQHQLPLLPPKIWDFVSGGLQGFLGAFGFLIGMIVVPIYLFFFLLHSGRISERWGDYLPLRASPFKDEVVDCLNEINDYLISFFRGQIIVTLIDGAILAIVLLFMGIKFALLIGLMVAILQLIPYVGILLCWIPAVLITAVQFQADGRSMEMVFWVTVVFVIVTNLDGLVIAPRIVGNSVGLHPMTIIVSVFAWSLLVGGLLGALLAVPLTATLKVLLRRYVWERQFRAPQEEKVESPPPSALLPPLQP